MASAKHISSTTAEMNIQSALIHRCPAEILAYIFGLVIHDPRSHRIKPFLFTSVCKRWAEVACDTPSLWTRIQVRALHPDDEDQENNLVMDILDIHDEEEFEEYFESTEDIYVDDIKKQFTALMITVWIYRAKHLPLDISIEIDEEGAVRENFDDEYTEWRDYGFIGVFSDLLGLFLPYSKRWRTLRIPLHREVIKPLQYLIDDSDDRLPVLSSLELQPISSQAKWLDLRYLESLNSLKLSHPQVTDPLYDIPLNGKNITRFVCSIPIRINCVKAVLNNLSSAVHLAFESVTVNSPQTGDYFEYVPFGGPSPGDEEWAFYRDDFDIVGANPIYLPYLQNLVICMQDRWGPNFGEEDALERIFNNLTTPSLKSLVVEEQYKKHISFGALNIFFRWPRIYRSQCPMKKLVLNGFVVDSEPGYDSDSDSEDSEDDSTRGHSVRDLVSLLTSLTSLEELTLHTPGHAKMHELWDAFQKSRDFLPRLKTLQYTGPLHFTVSGLVEMLQSRWHTYDKGLARLERVILKINYEVEKRPKWPEKEKVCDNNPEASMIRKLQQKMVEMGYEEEKKPATTTTLPAIAYSDKEAIADIRILIDEGMLVSIAGMWEEGDVFGARDRYEIDSYPDFPVKDYQYEDFPHPGYVSRQVDPHWGDAFPAC